MIVDMEQSGYRMHSPYVVLRYAAPCHNMGAQEQALRARLEAEADVRAERVPAGARPSPGRIVRAPGRAVQPRLALRQSPVVPTTSPSPW